MQRQRGYMTCNTHLTMGFPWHQVCDQRVEISYLQLGQDQPSAFRQTDSSTISGIGRVEASPYGGVFCLALRYGCSYVLYG